MIGACATGMPAAALRIRGDLEYPQDSHAMLELLIPGLALRLGAGLMEEFGWRGFPLPHLLKRHSPRVSSLGIGLIWGGLWHACTDYLGLSGEGLDFRLLMLMLGRAS